MRGLNYSSRSFDFYVKIWYNIDTEGNPIMWLQDPMTGVVEMESVMDSVFMLFFFVFFIFITAVIINCGIKVSEMIRGRKNKKIREELLKTVEDYKPIGWAFTQFDRDNFRQAVLRGSYDWASPNQLYQYMREHEFYLYNLK